MAELAAPELSIVIPLYREGAHLDSTLDEITAVVDSLDVRCELVLVDDGSPDDTWRVIESRCRASARFRGLRLSRNFGKEAALAAGLEQARGRAIIVMDGDLQHPPAVVPEMLRRWREGADVVEAVKQHRGAARTGGGVQARAFNTLFSLLTGFDLQGATDFKLMDRRVVDAWRTMSERNLFFRGMNAWLGFRRVRIPFDVEQRAEGRSQWSLWQLARLAETAVTSFSSAPLYLIVAAGLTFAIVAVVLGAQTIYLKLTGQAVDGFTTVILLLLIIGSVLMVGMGLVGIYLARIYEEVKRRPRYVIAEQLG
jgi:polyisoprenyl-phosphate glycosyltransferase